MRRPSVGVGCIVLKNGLVLVGRRKGAHGEGTWCVPGGHLEWGETPEACAAREALEETGVTVKNMRVVGCTNDVFNKEDKHYVTLFVQADWASGEPTCVDPAYEEVRWCTWDAIPTPLFLPLTHFKQQGYKP